MAKKSINLLSATDPEWVNVIINNFDAFLADHANCERKASSLAMSMVVRYPDRPKIITALVELAQEELEHFGQVYALMEKRGVSLIKDEPDPYVNQLCKLMRHGRSERFLDQLLVSSIIECRGAERFRLIAEALKDPELKHFYKVLSGVEAKHGHVFVDMALHYFTEEEVYPRLQELAKFEAKIVAKLEWRASLH
ncbi:MAG: tRNA-(ms[2]io[6]A)-hydroxylase [Gammaproteobacteria bacterium]|nr:tRNA-(ms[2]io[6]A)-hydroxylase [Beggiatoa alba]PCH60933.1 MAG: tRNA-(ms[2]io[6]A)-hydroxylase [Gammaproteobacteria bacterium]